jgi:hypothetical protein
MNELPPPPIAAEVDLTDFSFMQSRNGGLRVERDLPDAPVPAEVDLREFGFTPMYRGRLFSSDFHANVTDAEWRAGVTLWLKSWDQVPAGSLPSDDVGLARAAEFARDLKSWRKVKSGALHGWYQCSDGRLYHKVVAEVVMEAWTKKRTASNKGKAGAAKRWHSGNAHASESDGTGNATGIAQALAQALPTPIPNDSKGQGQGQGQGQGHTLADSLAPKNVPRETESEIRARVDRIKAVYPKAARPNWIAGEKGARNAVLRGDATWGELEAGCLRYAKHCEATGRIPQDPGNFFAAEDRPWTHDWLIPVPKAKPGARAAPSDDAAWMEAKALAKEIGFRDPYPAETVTAYAAAAKLARDRPPSIPLSDRRGLAGIKRIGAQ